MVSRTVVPVTWLRVLFGALTDWFREWENRKLEPGDWANDGSGELRKVSYVDFQNKLVHFTCGDPSLLNQVRRIW